METLAEKVGDVQVLHLRGRLDLNSSEEFATLLNSFISGGEIRIILDCRELQYVGSSGLGAFIAAGKKLGPNGRLVFAALNRQVQSVFDMTGLMDLFETCDTTEDSLRMLSAP